MTLSLFLDLAVTSLTCFVKVRPESRVTLSTLIEFEFGTRLLCISTFGSVLYCFGSEVKRVQLHLSTASFNLWPLKKSARDADVWLVVRT